MSKVSKLELTLAGILLGAAGAAMPAPALEGHLTIRGAAELAVQGNHELVRQRHHVALSEVSVAAAEASFQPDLSVSLSPSERFGRAFDQTTGQLETERTSGLSLRAASNLNLYDGAERKAGLQAARRARDAEGLDLTRAEQRIGYEAASRFIGVLTAVALVDVEQENVTAQNQQLERIRAYRQRGTRSQTDVLQQEAAVAAADLRLLSAEQDEELARLRLKQTLRLDLDEPVDLATPDFRALTAAPLPAAESIVAEALVARADVAGQRQRIVAAEAGQVQAQAVGKPSVGLSVSAGTSYSGSNPDGFPDQFADQNPNAAVGLTLALPVFDRGQARSAEARARIQVEIERLALMTLERGIALDVRAALLDDGAARKRLVSAEAQRAAAAAALEAMQARYATGVATFVELSQARAQYVEAAAGQVEALHQVALARLALAYQLGGTALAQALQELTAVP